MGIRTLSVHERLSHSIGLKVDLRYGVEDALVLPKSVPFVWAGRERGPCPSVVAACQGGRSTELILVVVGTRTLLVVRLK